MSDLEHSAKNFLQRWSQRKRAAVKHTSDNTDLSPNDKEADLNAEPQSDADPLAFDPATLPPIESITAASDIRAFLAIGVPEELTRAALRRAWMTDPAIRNFIGIAENQWDFTKSDGVPGFGSLELTPVVRRMVTNLIGDATRQADQRRVEAELVEQIPETAAQLSQPAKASAPGEDQNRAELSPTRTDFAISEDTRTDPARAVAQDINGDSDNQTSTQKGISNAGERSRSIHRKHGGAVPR